MNVTSYVQVAHQGKATARHLIDTISRWKALARPIKLEIQLRLLAPREGSPKLQYQRVASWSLNCRSTDNIGQIKKAISQAIDHAEHDCRVDNPLAQPPLDLAS